MLDLAVLYREQRAYVRACLVSCRVPDATLQDAIQDVFVVLFRRAADFDDTRGTLRAWLFGISFRVALQHRRKAGRPTLSPDMLHADDAVADPESYASQLRAAELATEILDTLPREQLSVLVLSEIEGLTGPEIATALDLQLG
ncbi:MAG: sigma-70 family RNA polymerase sigma factor, partial [Nannocystaceae bacterium]|nr:sigma-70 family RNA polymerase sigma factor [Nannocystaceae bacterium]